MSGAIRHVRLLSHTPAVDDRGLSEFIASTDAVARDGDIIDQSSWVLSPFRTNPVILNNHNPREVVGRAIEVNVVDTEHGKQLRASVQWDDSEFNPVGRLVAHQHRSGFRRAVSVSWIPGESISRGELDPEHPYYQERPSKLRTSRGVVERFGLLHRKNQLLEVSSVSIPSDPNALQVRGSSPEDDLDAAIRAYLDSERGIETLCRMLDAPRVRAKLRVMQAIRAVGTLDDLFTPQSPRGLAYLFEEESNG